MSNRYLFVQIIPVRRIKANSVHNSPKLIKIVAIKTITARKF